MIKTNCYDCKFLDSLDINDYETEYFCGYEFNRQLKTCTKTGILYPEIKCKNFLHRTTANVRFGWITSLTQMILRITSYIRKRCKKFCQPKRIIL